MDRPKDKPWFLTIAKLLSISKKRVTLDECHDYIIQADEGHIHAVAPYWYVYFNPDSTRRWNNAKKTLNFMEVVNDGDTEGMFRADFPPSPKQADLIRKLLKIRRSYIPAHLSPAPKKIV